MLEFFFPKKSAPKPEPKEPRLLPFEDEVIDLMALPPAPPAAVRKLSPRQMADWAHEMYLAGALSWEEYAGAIPAELHPDYDSTVGALTGEMARPDKPRDMVRHWEEKADFIRRHSPWDDLHLRRAERIVILLRRTC